ncbi:hypothetical protein HNP46_000985 [Pseudomonas nitritireducens]|uniref:Metal ABC transporter ATPase n=1 Tax=Pseudomonas nitroreducens TaxID=46680 RepID=A0A7W7P0D1_PSENT|nr:DUF6482 family protein [Pseudomonas nitritireducens]MBB4862147.1 hypothetical protein [Pseudomonas nitritireducens]
MTLEKLAQAAATGQVQGIEVISLEGGFYVLQARLASATRPVCDDHGRVLHLRSTTQVRELLAELAPLPCELVQHCAHDEIGAAPASAPEPLRIPLSLERPW